MTRSVGSYTLGARLGRGGAGDVYEATHRFLGDPVAIKLLRGDAGDGLLAEATRTRAIEHPNVVRVLDCGRDDATGIYYIVMERAAGETLAARLARGRRLDEAELRRIGAAIGDGLQAAHDCGVVHRDLKPANIMLHGDVPKILDFGIARHLGEQSAVTTGRRVGTVAYMAPEQLTGGLVAPCVDVWALGVTLFEAVTGRLPFSGFDDGRCPQLFERAPRASGFAEVSPALDALLASCLEREPGKRPSMAALARALRTGAADERFTEDLGDVPAPPPSRRRRAWIAAAAAAAVVALAVAAIAARSGETELAPVAAVPDASSPALASPPAPASPPAIDAGAPARAASIEVRSDPSGAQIRVDGAARGVTPAHVSVELPATIELRRRGYRPARVRAEIAAPIDVTLVRVPRRRARPASTGEETLD